MEHCDALKAWLRFNSSPTDDYFDNSWTAVGTPSVSSNGAEYGNALQLDGNSYLKNTSLISDGETFTVDFWLKCPSDLSSSANGYIFCLYNNTLSKIVAGAFYSNRYVRIFFNRENGQELRFYNLPVSDASSHVTMVYKHGDTWRNTYVYIFINGVLGGYIQEDPRSQAPCDLVIGARYDGSRKANATTVIDEFRVYNGIAPWITTITSAPYLAGFTPPVSDEYSGIFFLVDYLADAQREISRAETVIVDAERVIDKSWRYENYGTADLLTVTGNTVNNLPLSKSAIGMAFWQSGREGCFDIPATKELWAKWDLYYTGTAKWRVYDRKDSKDTGIARMNNTTSLVCYINGPLSVDVKPAGTITQGTRKTYLLHMVSDATDGYIELWIDGVKYYSDNFQSQGLIYKGNVNDGDYFSNFYMQSDNNTNLFSNVIISNRQIGLGENVWDIVGVDAERSLYRSELLDLDLVRAITVNSIPVDFDADLCREISASQLLDLDTEREISTTLNFDVDCERITGGVLTLSVDAERKIANVVTVHFDKEWGYFSGTELLLDTEREIAFSVNFNLDLMRKIPHKITDVFIPPTPPEPSPGIVPPADKSAFLQSCTVSLAEQQLTDNITFVFNGTCEIMDAVDFQLLDYTLRGRVEETTTRGVMTTCKCTVDIDAVLYQQLAYSVPPNKWEYTEEYIDYVHSKGGSIITDPGYEDAELKATPSAPASAHITEIAAKLGKSVSLHFTDFISTMSTDVKSGTNYAGLLQELFGWTARLPHIMINCYIRGNTIYVVQRGQEQNTVTLDSQKLTVHTVNKKLVRTTWGSDPWSKTEVSPYFNNWTEGVFEPMQDEGGEGGAKYNDDGLVEETTVQHGDETVVTHYYYETLENGQKFLYQEVATTYNGGSKVDEVTTTHDPVRNTQSHVYSTDDDGVLGGVVTSSNNDDRITPWAQSQGAASFGAQVYTDNEGNRYIWKGVIYHSDKGGMAERTINGISLIDTSFPVEGESFLQALTNQIMWLDRRTEETVTVEVFDYPHLIDFNDKIVFHGNTYYLRSNTATINEKDINRQSLEFVRWY